MEARIADEALPPGDFFGAADFQPLPFLGDADILRSIDQRAVRAGIEPGIATAHDLHVERAFVHVEPVEIGNLKLAARAGLKVAGAVDHGFVIEI